MSPVQIIVKKVTLQVFRRAVFRRAVLFLTCYHQRLRILDLELTVVLFHPSLLKVPIANA